MHQTLVQKRSEHLRPVTVRPVNDSFAFSAFLPSAFSEFSAFSAFSSGRFPQATIFRGEEAKSAFSAFSVFSSGPGVARDAKCDRPALSWLALGATESFPFGVQTLQGNILWVPDALVLCPLWGFKNSETPVNQKRQLTLSRRIGKSAFPSLRRVRKGVFAWCVKSRSQDVVFMSPILRKYRKSNIENVCVFDFQIFWSFDFEPGVKKTPFPKTLGTVEPFHCAEVPL